MTLDEIKQEIATLSPKELARLRVWLAQFGSSERQAKPEPQVQTPASKFGRLAGRATTESLRDSLLSLSLARLASSSPSRRT